MKTRNGFVSNSSSSSFIISDKDFPSVRDLAEYMIKQQLKEYLEEDEEYYKWKDEDIETSNILLSRLKNVDENHPISFPSCNYDTYIKKIGDQYIVATCNNTDWNLDEYRTRLSSKTKDILTEMRNSYVVDSEDYNNLDSIINQEYEYDFFGNDYYSLNKEIIGVETYECCDNVDKHDISTYFWDTPKYGKICLVCDEHLFRENKI